MSVDSKQADMLTAEEMWVVESGHDGAENVIVTGVDSLKAKIHELLCMCGKPVEKCESEGVPETVAMIDDDNEWESRCGYPRWSWSQNFEDGYIHIVHLTDKTVAELRQQVADLRMKWNSVLKSEDAALKGWRAAESQVAKIRKALEDNWHYDLRVAINAILDAAPPETARPKEVE